MPPWRPLPVGVLFGMSLVSNRHIAIALWALLVGAGLWMLAGREKSAEDRLRAFMQKQDIPGAVLAYGHDGEQPTLVPIGLADAESGEAVTPDARFKLASLSKPVTASAILALQEQGKLRLEDRAATYLPWVLEAADPRAHAITLYQLLNHTAGLDTSSTGDPFFLAASELDAYRGEGGGPISSCEPVAHAALAYPLADPPGKSYQYSNVGYCLLGLVIEIASGQPYEHAVKALVPEAAGLTLEAGMVTVRLHGAEESAEYLVHRPDVIAAAGGWIASAESYYRFAARPIAEPIGLGSLKQGADNYYGLGWRVWPGQGEGFYLTHYGAMPGTYGLVLRGSGGFTAVLLMNARPADDLSAFNHLFGILKSLTKR